MIKTESAGWSEDNDPTTVTARSTPYPWVQMIASLVALLVCCNVMVDIAVNIAHQLHISTLVIGITIVAFGSSLPELVAALVSVYRNKSSMAIGTIIGSNIFNSFAIMGSAVMIYPSRILPEMVWRDFAAMLIITCVVWALFVLSRKNCIGKAQGVLLIIYFIAYMGYLLKTASPPSVLSG